MQRLGSSQQLSAVFAQGALSGLFTMASAVEEMLVSKYTALGVGPDAALSLARLFQTVLMYQKDLKGNPATALEAVFTLKLIPRHITHNAIYYLSHPTVQLNIGDSISLDKTQKILDSLAATPDVRSHAPYGLSVLLRHFMALLVGPTKASKQFPRKENYSRRTLASLLYQHVVREQTALWPDLPVNFIHRPMAQTLASTRTTHPTVFYMDATSDAALYKPLTVEGTKFNLASSLPRLVMVRLADPVKPTSGVLLYPLPDFQLFFLEITDVALYYRTYKRVYTSDINNILGMPRSRPASTFAPSVSTTRPAPVSQPSAAVILDVTTEEALEERRQLPLGQALSQLEKLDAVRTDTASEPAGTTPEPSVSNPVVLEREEEPWRPDSPGVEYDPDSPRPSYRERTEAQEAQEEEAVLSPMVLSFAVLESVRDKPVGQALEELDRGDPMESPDTTESLSSSPEVLEQALDEPMFLSSVFSSGEPASKKPKAT